MIKNFNFYIFGVSLFVFCNCIAAANLLKVVDQKGNPLKNAVVAFPAPENYQPDLSEIAIMDQVSKQFVPQLLIINRGQQVSFPNSDDVRHNVYSFSSVKPFQLKLYKGSNQKPILYDSAGIGVLGCNIHDSMVAHIYVADGEVAKMTDENGIVGFEQTLPDMVTIWHAEQAIGVASKTNIKVEFKHNQKIAILEVIAVKETQKSNTFRSKKFGSKGN